jgi:hypothetical protein
MLARVTTGTELRSSAGDFDSIRAAVIRIPECLDHPGSIKLLKEASDGRTRDTLEVSDFAWA